MAHRMIPMLWFRIFILIGFLGYTAYAQMWLLAGIGVVLLVLTGFQLRTAQATRDRVRSDAAESEKKNTKGSATKKNRG
ncbi:hypothetical protein [Corynebacterium meridianum]|uniref:Uncharacterized protein n=1 Tax=Corynebacterium meridianum TaxID=2765363 RepID=A0A934I444_9CORY|nr:hypothetical protein [Corynebacterium meridianum]MBI8988844.1 hypothetical protein [Corynebacterium meridianum]